MSIFEVVFNLVGLVLGLALVEVLAGLTKLIKARGRIKVGWLVPLLGIWVLGDVTSFWGQAYELRERMPSVWPSLGVGLLITSVYYVAASTAMPSDLDSQAKYDESYWINRRIVFGLILLCNCSSWGIALALGRPWEPIVWAINLSYAALLLAALFVPGRRANIAILLALIGNLTWGFATP